MNPDDIVIYQDPSGRVWRVYQHVFDKAAPPGAKLISTIPAASARSQGINPGPGMPTQTPAPGTSTPSVSTPSTATATPTPGTPTPGTPQPVATQPSTATPATPSSVPTAGPASPTTTPSPTGTPSPSATPGQSQPKGPERPDDVITYRNRITGAVYHTTRANWDTNGVDALYEVTNAEASPARYQPGGDLQGQTPPGSPAPQAPGAPTPTPIAQVANGPVQGPPQTSAPSSATNPAGIVPPGQNPTRTPGGHILTQAQTPVPPEIESEKAFLDDYGSFGGKITQAVVNMPNGTPGAQKTYTVTYLLNDGQSTVTRIYQQGQTGALEATGTQSDIKTNVAAQQALTIAQTESQRAQTAGYNEDTKTKALANAQRLANAARGKGNNTDTEVAQIAQSGNTGAATIAQAQAAQAGVDINYVRAVTEVLQQKGYSAQQAYQMALNMAVEKAKIDTSNTNTVVQTSQDARNGDITQRGQDVSLANQRLSTSSQGFSDDARSAIDLNQYLPAGSDQGGKFLLGLTGMRMALAKKYGGLDTPQHVGLTPIQNQLVNHTPISLPGLDPAAITAQGEQIRNQWGVDNDAWPVVPGRPFGGPNGPGFVQPVSSIPSSATTPGKTPDTTGSQPASAPAAQSTPATQSGTPENPVKATLPFDPAAESGFYNQAVKNGGGQMLSKPDASGNVWVSDPSIPGGRAKINANVIPPEKLPSRADYPNLPDFEAPAGAKPATAVDYSNGTPAPTSARSAAMVDQQNVALAQQDEEEKKRRRQQMMGNPGYTQALFNGTASPFDAYFPV